MYIIDTTWFDECFLFHVITRRHYIYTNLSLTRGLLQSPCCCVLWDKCFERSLHFKSTFSTITLQCCCETKGPNNKASSSKMFFFSIGVFFHDHSRLTGLQGKGKCISLTPHYHFHPLHRRLGISRAITTGSSSLHIGSSRTRTGSLWFPSASR